eukprot:2688094-Amphidinium_carterae.1
MLVNYCRKHDIPGRRYATSASLQYLTREARAAAVGGEVGGYKTFDVDIKNCHPSLMLQLAMKLMPAEADAFPMLSAYNANVEVWRSAVGNILDLQPDEAKKALIQLFYSGAPWKDVPFMWALAHEVNVATHTITEHPDHVHLKAMFASRKNPL